MTNLTPNTLRCQVCGGPLPPKAQRWCSKEHANAGYNATHRADRTAKQRARREAARRAKAGLPPVLTPEQQAIADLTAQNTELRRIVASRRKEPNV